MSDVNDSSMPIDLEMEMEYLALASRLDICRAMVEREHLRLSILEYRRDVIEGSDSKIADATSRFAALNAKLVSLVEDTQILSEKTRKVLGYLPTKPKVHTNLGDMDDLFTWN